MKIRNPQNSVGNYLGPYSMVRVNHNLRVTITVLIKGLRFGLRAWGLGCTTYALQA